MIRRRAGTALAGLGAALLLFVGWRYAEGAVAHDAARAAWNASQARAAVLVGARAASPARRPARLLPGAPVARLRIPAIGLDEIVVEGAGEQQLDAGPGHFPGSAWPGGSGNAVISGHRDRDFHGLDRVAPGDTITTDAFGRRVTWLVVGRRIVRRDAPALFSTRTPVLTLTTCWPVTYLGPAPDRLLVTAVPIHRTPALANFAR